MNFQICNFKLFFGPPYCAITQALNMQGFGIFFHSNCIFSSQIELTKMFQREFGAIFILMENNHECKIF